MSAEKTLSSSIVPVSVSIEWSASPTEARCEDAVREAYENAVRYFNDTLTDDECKKIWLFDKPGIVEVQEAVLAAKTKYESRSQQSKAHKWLTRLSERIVCYGKVLDTLANQHPEYIALPWGAMRFLLTAIVNHEESIAQLSKALAQIAGALPRANVALLLYPTEKIKHAVSTLYAHLIKFMQRAIKWYEEGRVKHIITAMIRAIPLRFQDVLDEIICCSQTIDELAASATQAELRDMHLLFLEFKRSMIENQAINSNIFLDSKRRICEIQFSQILSFTSTTNLPDPEETFRRSCFLSKRRQLKSTFETNPSWRSRKLKAWANAKTSSLVVARGSCLTRHETKDFAADMVALLRAMKIPVVWTLSAKADGNLGWRSPIDVLKQLILQILRLNQTLVKDQSPALNAARFQSAITESEWFEILRSVLKGLQQIYIVVDAEVLSPEFSSQISWPDTFNKIFEDMKAECCQTIVKVVLVSFGASPYIPAVQPTMFDDATIWIGSDRRTGSATMRKKYFRSRSSRQGADGLRPFLLHSSTSTNLG